MKKRILVLSIAFCSNVIAAQDVQNYQELVHMIDSMKKEYSVKELINSPMVKRPYQYRNNYEVLTTEYQDKIINHICELYNQTEYFGLYTLASVLLYDYYGYSKEDIKKKIIDVWYDKRCYSSFSITSIGDFINYSEKTKQRLLNILAKKWTQEDIDIWKLRSEQSLRQYYINDYKRDVQNIMRETNRKGKDVEKILLDSLLQDAVKRNIKININRPISQSCILIIGSLKDERFVSGLESMLEEYKDYPEIKEACTYALAKLGVQKYINEIFKNNEDIKWWYLGTKDAFFRWLEINRNWNRWDRLCSECGSLPAPLISLWNAQSYVKNDIPKELKIGYRDIEYFCLPDWKDCDSTKVENSKQTIQKINKLYQWLIDNKDILILPPANDRF